MLILLIFSLLGLNFFSLSGNKTLYNQAMITFEQKNFTRASELFSKLLKSPNYRTKAYLALAKINLQQRNLEAAHLCFKNALASNTAYGPEYSINHMHCYIGSLFMKYNELDIAQKYFKKAVLFYDKKDSEPNPLEYLERIKEYKKKEEKLLSKSEEDSSFFNTTPKKLMLN